MMYFADSELINLFHRTWQSGESMNCCLSQFVAASQSRAAGCWRLNEGFLKLVGFGWADDMPPEVSEGFQNATQYVSIAQLGLGIVKAAVSQSPAIGRLDASATGLASSATWIERFGARTSLAVPILASTTHDVLGVLAVSTAVEIQKNDGYWKSLILLANELGAITVH
ncbi:hypothetical protein [Schlesneria paludicola]|uniref:hypothetical protein n=1 Tax=Schlesneria paludicola TaxID=360056 RepID=UPI000492C3BA|nr:hypothetical protein [Schlesneria paludicola]